jgi:hypothetical protein
VADGRPAALMTEVGFLPVTERIAAGRWARDRANGNDEFMVNILP